MASHSIVAASNEVVLEIQLNKLINDFLFPEVENYKAPRVQDEVMEERDGSKLREDPPCQGESHTKLAIEDGCPSEEMGTTFHQDNEKRPITADVRLDFSSQGYAEIMQKTSKLNVFRLSKAHSIAGSLFCFAIEREEKKESDMKCGGNPRKGERGSTKLSRVCSIPCHSKIHDGSDKDIRHSYRKPPRPPKPASGKVSGGLLLTRHTSTDNILVLHGTSRKASRSERRKKLAAASSSYASIWALIFTLCFALAIIGEGFWSQGSPVLGMKPKANASLTASNVMASTHLNLITIPALRRAGEQNTWSKSQASSGRSEEKMQLWELWVSKGLDASRDAANTWDA